MLNLIEKFINIIIFFTIEYYFSIDTSKTITTKITTMNTTTKRGRRSKNHRHPASPATPNLTFSKTCLSRHESECQQQSQSNNNNNIDIVFGVSTTRVEPNLNIYFTRQQLSLLRSTYDYTD